MSSKVAYASRKEGSKSAPKMQLQMKQTELHPSGMVLPTGADLRQVTVLGRGEWDRIQFQLHKRQIEKERLDKIKQERVKLHELSKEAVCNWNNTLQGQRMARLHAHEMKIFKTEEERKMLDLEEEKFQAQERKKAIEKAKTKQYYQTDRVKNFHSALLLTEVLKEREAQVELKRLKERAGDGQDKEYDELARRTLEEGILRDQEEARKRAIAAKEAQSFQKAQIKQHLKTASKNMEEDKIEGEELRRLGAQFEMEKVRLKEIRRSESNQFRADNIRQIEDVKRMEKIKMQRDEEEDEECRIFAAAKRKMMTLRAEKERQIHKEKQETLERIREKLLAQMTQKADDEDSLIQNAVEIAEAKRNKEEEEKYCKQREMQEAIAQHRCEQLREQERKLLEQKKKELETLMVRRQADDVFKENENIKRNKRFEEAKQLQVVRLQQARETREREKLLKDGSYGYDSKNQCLVEEEEKQFQEYAKKVIDHAEKRGRNTYPLRVAAREGAGGGLGPQFPGKGGVRPSYMTSDQSGVQLPNYQRDTTDETKKNIYGDGRTDKRLGFVW